MSQFDWFSVSPEPSPAAVSARGERQLVCALFVQVLRDLHLPAYRESARAWLRSEACAALCVYVDLDVAAVRALAEAEHPPRLPWYRVRV